MMNSIIICAVCPSVNIIRVRSKRMRFVGSVSWGEVRNVCKVLIGKPE
jgi:hypothetical protein